jgi:hypothetical protein
MPSTTTTCRQEPAMYVGTIAHLELGIFSWGTIFFMILMMGAFFYEETKFFSPQGPARRSASREKRGRWRPEAPPRSDFVRGPHGC